MTGAAGAARLPAVARTGRTPWARVLTGALLLWAATPPACLPGGEFLVLPGLMVFYALATAAPRPGRACYVLGSLHVAAFSWSTHHVLFLGWVAIGLLGGLYYAAVAVATRGLVRLSGPVAFGIAVAAAAWARANMPEILYPHGQPCHSLWEWPALLGSVRWGGEALANFVLAALAAAAVDGWRRRSDPRLRRGSRVRLGVVGAFAVAATAVAPPAAPRAAGPETLDVVALEPGIHPTDAFVGMTDEAAVKRLLRERYTTRLLEPTHRIAGSAVADPPALVLWPESSVYDVLPLAAGRPRFRFPLGLDLREPVRVCLGASVSRLPDEEPHLGRSTPAAVLVSAQGDYLAHHEKRRLVPAGERLPLVDLLPAALADRLRQWVLDAMGHVPDALPGQTLPPLQTAAGVPFAALLCYDNAFPEVARVEVAAGARLLVVLSNEAWYRGGAELHQLVAMTVLRALETATPLVRSTADGLTCAVGADGRILARLPQATAPAEAARTLRVFVPLGPGRLPPLAWLHSWFAVVVAVTAGFGFLLGCGPWARLRKAGTTPPVRAPGTSPGS
jgi:apolipoprotein N-acyltransferase